MWPRRSRVRAPSVTLRSPGTRALVFATQRLSCTTSASSSTAEHRTLNPQVLGSNPRGRTRLRGRRSGPPATTAGWQRGSAGGDTPRPGPPAPRSQHGQIGAGPEGVGRTAHRLDGQRRAAVVGVEGVTGVDHQIARTARRPTGSSPRPPSGWSSSTRARPSAPRRRSVKAVSSLVTPMSRPRLKSNSVPSIGPLPVGMPRSSANSRRWEGISSRIWSTVGRSHREIGMEADPEGQIGRSDVVGVDDHGEPVPTQPVLDGEAQGERIGRARGGARWPCSPGSGPDPPCATASNGRGRGWRCWPGAR